MMMMVMVMEMMDVDVDVIDGEGSRCLAGSLSPLSCRCGGRGGRARGVAWDGTWFGVPFSLDAGCRPR